MNTNNIKELLSKQEGKSDIVYYDIFGNLTIGIGFNLHRPNSRAILSKYGYDLKHVISGQRISDEAIYGLFDFCIDEAIEACKNSIKRFGFLPESKQEALVCMAFNLGGTRFRKFKKMIDAINSVKYELAIIEMLDSEWHKQLPNRSLEIARLFAE